MRNSMDSGFNEIKDVKSRRGIREEANFRKNLEDRSNSEPPRSLGAYHPPARLKMIREKDPSGGEDGSSDEDSQLNESDLDIEIPESASASVSQAPTPTPLSVSHARRINSETNLDDSKRRMSGFMGNRSKRFCASTSELSFSSHLDTQKSLFSAKNNALSRQSFNSSLYGSNASLSSTNSRLFMVNSPFYSGKTMFGGASAYPKRDIKSSQHKSLRTPVQMRPSSSLSNSSEGEKPVAGVPESNAARRILEVMNQFSGPIKEARTLGNNINSFLKIPLLVQDRKRFGDEDRLAAIQPVTPYGRPIGVKSRPESPILGPATKPLQIPTMSQLLQMKKLQSNTEKVREIASRSDSFLNQDQEYKLPTISNKPSNGDHGTSLKMKSNITKNILRNDKNSTEQLALPVNLPNIQLPQLKSIPKFDIQVASSKLPTEKTNINTISSKPTVQFNLQKIPEVEIRTQKEKSKFEFSFSKPMSLEVGRIDTELNFEEHQFVFAKPSQALENNEQGLTSKSPNPRPAPTASSDNLFKDIVAKQKDSSWECDSCLTRNGSEKTQCLCCSAMKKDNVVSPLSSLLTSSSVAKTDSLFHDLASKQKSSQWECNVCMVNNLADVDECLCCQAPKPGSQAKKEKTFESFSFGVKPVTTQPPVEDNLFKNLVSKQQSQWECDICMVRNDSTRDKCLSCETPKPGSKPATAPTNSAVASASTFSFGMPAAPSADETFKKIVSKQTSNWECSTCMTRNEQSVTKCVCCEQAKPGTGQSAPSFSFGSKLTSTVSLPLPSEVKFQFGMPTASASATVSSPPSSEKTNDFKIEEVSKTKPMFSFGMNSTTETLVDSAPAGGFNFTKPATASGSSDFTVVSQKVDGKKDEPENTPSNSNTTEFKFKNPAVMPVKPSESEKTDLDKVEFKNSANTKVDSVPNLVSSNGGFSFGSFSSKTMDKTDSSQRVEGLSFDSPKPFVTESDSEKSILHNKPSTVLAGVASTAASPASAATFVFGQPKNENSPAQKTFGSFGGLSSTPTFGQSNPSPFSANKEESAPKTVAETPIPNQPSIFSFGASKPAAASPLGNMLFGSSTSNAVQTATPVFGSGFSVNTNNNNNSIDFGSKMPSFGNQSQKRSFEFSAGSNDVNQNKKFDFGTTQGNPAQAFQFGSQVTENKPPAFNFASSAPRGFNFTNATPQAPSSAPVMQFNSTGVTPQIAIPGITFSAQGTGSNAANQRKILRAARRTTTRR